MSNVVELRPGQPSDSAVIEAVRRYTEARAAFDAVRLENAPEREVDAIYDRERRTYDAMMATTPATAAGWLPLIERLIADEAGGSIFPTHATPEQISAFLVKLREYFSRAAEIPAPDASK